MTTNAERQAAYKERMRAAGFVQVAVWVPANKKVDLLAFAEFLCLKKSPPKRGKKEDRT